MTQQAAGQAQAPEIQIAGESLRVVFNRWDQESYKLFLRTKALPEHSLTYDPEVDAYTLEAPARFAKILGVKPPKRTTGRLRVPAHLWDYQRHFLGVALDAKRFALWWDTGLGKTAMAWEWCRQVAHLTGGRVLFIAPLNLIEQHRAEARHFYGSDLGAQVLGSRAALRSWCRDGSGIAMVNPEKFIPPAGEPEVLSELTYCAGVVLDESSCLKTGGGVVKWALIKSCRGVEYKLSLTATPAPNDPIEYASQAAWLEKIRDEGEVIWTYFVRDDEGEWKIKDHALPAFYRFLAGWSCYVRHPAAYGFADNLKDLPAPQRIVHEIAPSAAQLAAISHVPDATGQTSLVAPQRLGVVERDRMGQLSAGFLYDGRGGAERVESGKPVLIAELVRVEVAAGLPVLVWTNYDESAAIVAEQLAGVRFAALTGATPQSRRPRIQESFAAGEIDVLVTRPRVLGFGTNMQHVGAMVYADLNDSFEQLYQSERRAYRYGQTRSVRMHYPLVCGLQDPVWQNLESKRAAFERDVARMERLYIEALRS